jgi:GDPmannose 4,6-dehydratase
MGWLPATASFFNHESPHRGETFVTPKIMRGLARIYEGPDACLYMRNLDLLRDWGHSRDYLEMLWCMLQQEQPEDFVIATGRQESVRRFIELPQSTWAGLDTHQHARRAGGGDVLGD